MKEKIGPKLEKPLRLPEQVATRLVSKIKEGAFQPGEKLPSEAVLAEQFGVSRTVIREALARLKYDGLLDSHPGIGATVVEKGKKRTFRLDDFDQLSTKDIEHLFELRAILEGYAAFLAAGRRSPDQVERLNKSLGLMAEAVDKDRDDTALDANFHSIVAEASSNPYLNELMQLLSDMLVNLIRKARGDTNQNSNLLPRNVQKEHKAIYKAIADKKPVEARTAVLTHIKNAGDRLGVKVETTI